METKAKVGAGSGGGEMLQRGSGETEGGRGRFKPRGCGGEEMREQVSSNLGDEEAEKPGNNDDHGGISQSTTYHGGLKAM
jgi:hypothetical protein